MGAGAGTALDLMQQTRARAALKHRVGATAQKKGTLQHINRTGYSTGRGKRTVIFAFTGARAAMLENTGGTGVAGNQNIGKGFIIPKQNIKTRT